VNIQSSEILKIVCLNRWIFLDISKIFFGIKNIHRGFLKSNDGPLKSIVMCWVYIGTGVQFLRSRYSECLDKKNIKMFNDHLDNTDRYKCEKSMI